MFLFPQTLNDDNITYVTGSYEIRDLNILQMSNTDGN